MRLPGIALLLFLASGLQAETLLMLNGTVIRGQITAQDRNNVTIQTPSGVQVIPKAQIRRIVFDDSRYDAEQK